MSAQNHNRIQYTLTDYEWAGVEIQGVSFVGDSSSLYALNPHISSVCITLKNNCKIYTPFNSAVRSRFVIYNNLIDKLQTNIGIQQQMQKNNFKILHSGLDTTTFLRQLEYSLLSDLWDSYYNLEQTNSKKWLNDTLKNAFIDYFICGITQLDVELFKNRSNRSYIEYKLLFGYLFSEFKPATIKRFLLILKTKPPTEAMELAANKPFAIIKKELLAFSNLTEENYNKLKIEDSSFVKIQERYQFHSFGIRHVNKARKNKQRRLKKIVEPIHSFNIFNSLYPILVREDANTAYYLHPHRGSMKIIMVDKMNLKEKMIVDLECKEAYFINDTEKQMEFITLQADNLVYKKTVQILNGRIQQRTLTKAELAEHHSAISDLSINNIKTLRHFSLHSKGWYEQQLNLSYCKKQPRKTDSLIPLNNLPLDENYTKLHFNMAKSSFNFDVVSRDFLLQYQPYGAQMGNINNPQISAMTTYEATDILENKAYAISYRIPLNLNGSEYYMAYFNRTKRVDWGLSVVRSVRLNQSNNNSTWYDTDSRPIPPSSKQLRRQLNFHVAFPLNYKHTIQNHLHLNHNLLYFPSVSTYSHGFQELYGFDFINNLSHTYSLHRDRELQYFDRFLEHRLSLDIIGSLPSISYLSFGIESELSYKRKIGQLICFSVENKTGFSLGNKKILYRFTETGNNFVYNMSEKTAWTQNLPYSYQKIKNSFRGYALNELGSHAYNLTNIEFYSASLNELAGKSFRLNLINNLRVYLFYDNLLYLTGENNIKCASSVGAGIETKLNNRTVGFNIGVPLSSENRPLINLYIN